MFGLLLQPRQKCCSNIFNLLSANVKYTQHDDDATSIVHRRKTDFSKWGLAIKGLKDEAEDQYHKQLHLYIS